MILKIFLSSYIDFCTNNILKLLRIAKIIDEFLKVSFFIEQPRVIPASIKFL
jgi:hypothetical protein